MIDHLAYRYYLRWDISWRGYYCLSDKTKGLLAALDTDVDIVAFFQKSNELFDDVRNLLKEYEYEAAKLKVARLRIRIIDPDRDLALAKELARKYDVREANVVVFEAGGRRKYVETKDIADYEMFLSGGRAIKKRVAFRGEQVFSSAIQSITQTTRPIVYFLEGHGERDINDFGKHSGYSSLASIIRRDNMEVRTLLLAEHAGVPQDCSVLIIAGPDRKFSRTEIDFLSKYLDKNGRVLLLVDPAITIGLEDLLKNWGVELGAGVVVGLTLTGRELIVTQYGNHPITRNLRKVTTMFYMPRSLRPVIAEDQSQNMPADKPRVSILASNTKEDWEESDLDQTPPRFDAGVDLQGPIPVAVAVEKGPVGGIEVELRPTRMVIIGDSYFVSNRALSGGLGGNKDFFMSAVNWLVEREELMAISPKVPGELRLDMSREQLRRAYLIIAVALPLAVALIGFVVWLKRR